MTSDIVLCLSILSCDKAPNEVVNALESRCDSFINDRISDTSTETSITYTINSVKKDYKINDIYYYTAHISWYVETRNEDDATMKYVMFLANDIANAVGIDETDGFECDGKTIVIRFIDEYAYDTLSLTINGEFRNQPEKCKDCDKYFEDYSNTNSIRDTKYCVKCYNFISELYDYANKYGK
jgi:hypothetical protein